MIIDTHCHYNMPPLVGEDLGGWRTHWEKAQEHGVKKSIVIGVDIESSQTAIAIAKQDQNLKATVGFHPHAVVENKLVTPSFLEGELPNWMQQLSDLLTTNKQSKEIVAIGETGLDYFRLDLTNETNQLEKTLQQELCKAHILLANTFSLPLIFHVRDKNTDAYRDILSLIKENKKNDLPFILHCVSGSVEYVQEALTLGAYISVAGNVTYKSADSIREIVRITPKDKLLLETDAPFLPPVPHRGEMCEPWMIQLTAEYVQNTYHCSLEHILENTYAVFPIFSKS